MKIKGYFSKKHIHQALKYNLILNIVECVDSAIGIITLGIYRPHWTMHVCAWQVRHQFKHRKN